MVSPSIKLNGRPFRLLKMISFIILIGGLVLGVACKEGEQEPGTPEPTANVPEEQNPDLDGSTEGLSDLEGRMGELPHDEKTVPPLRDPKVLQGSGPEIMSAFPPEIDADQDGVVDRSLPNQPELPVDNCPQYYNPDQEDGNQNGIGDVCE